MDDTLTITYRASVFTPAGWRDVDITAEAVQISKGMARVERVIAIDGAPPKSSMSRTGANRQRYSGTAIAKREVGSRKRLSACVIEGVAA